MTDRRSPRLRLAEYLPYRLSVAAYAVSEMIGRSYARHFRLPLPQWRVLAIVNEYGALSQAQLVPLSTMDKQRVSRAARALQRRGLLRRVNDRRDRRTYALTLTVRGRALFGQLAPLALRHEAALLAGFAPREMQLLRRALLTLQQRATERALKPC